MSGKPAPGQSNTALAVISAMYSWAVSEDWPGVTTNPAYRVKQLHKSAKRQRMLEPHEFRPFWNNIENILASQCVPTILKLLLLTGQRRNEVIGTRRSDISYDPRMGWTWRIPAERARKTSASTWSHLRPIAAEIWAHAITTYS